MKKVYKFNVPYALVKPYVGYCFRFFYSSVTADGKDNIPRKQPYMLTPNHQNALMDALAALTSNRSMTVFLARSDIFTDKRIARILHFLRIMPIYRMRDGRDELSKNEQVFDESEEVLRSGSSLCMMPEGKQSFKRALAPLVKGTFRIAFQTQTHMPDKEINIIPVGVDYGNYAYEGEHLIVRYGEPIIVSEYLAEHDTSPAKALLTLRSACYDGISELTQNIKSEKYYNQIYSISNYFCDERAATKNKIDRLEARRTITNALNDYIGEDETVFEKLAQSVDEYESLLKKAGCDDLAVVAKGWAAKVIWLSFIAVLLLVPAILAWGINLIQQFLPRLFTQRFKKKDFVSSVNFVGYLVLHLLVSLTLLVISAFTALPFWVGIVVFFLAPPARRVTYLFLGFARKSIRSLRFSICSKRDKTRLKELRLEIKKAVNNIIE